MTFVSAVFLLNGICFSAEKGFASVLIKIFGGIDSFDRLIERGIFAHHRRPLAKKGAVHQMRAGIPADLVGGVAEGGVA